MTEPVLRKREKLRNDGLCRRNDIYCPLALTGVYTLIQNIHLYTREHSPTHTHILRNEGHHGCLGKEGLGF